MKEKINASAIPDAYLLCLNQDCPKATGCLRRIAEQQISDKVRLWRVISPKYQKNQTSDCPYFRQADLCTRFHRDAGADALPANARSCQQALEPFRAQNILSSAQRRTASLTERAKKHFEYTGTVWHR